VTTLSSNAIAVLVNGATREVPAGSTIAALLDWLGVSSDKVAVELNKSIVRKRDWDSAVVSAGAQIEIVEFVGGG
jgi:thiamine biosynthesis protein ThiS